MVQALGEQGIMRLQAVFAGLLADPTFRLHLSEAHVLWFATVMNLRIVLITDVGPGKVMARSYAASALAHTVIVRLRDDDKCGLVLCQFATVSRATLPNLMAANIDPRTTTGHFDSFDLAVAQFVSGSYEVQVLDNLSQCLYAAHQMRGLTQEGLPDLIEVEASRRAVLSGDWRKRMADVVFPAIAPFSWPFVVPIWLASTYSAASDIGEPVEPFPTLGDLGLVDSDYNDLLKSPRSNVMRS